MAPTMKVTLAAVALAVTAAAVKSRGGSTTQTTRPTPTPPKLKSQVPDLSANNPFWSRR